MVAMLASVLVPTLTRLALDADESRLLLAELCRVVTFTSPVGASAGRTESPVLPSDRDGGAECPYCHLAGKAFMPTAPLRDVDVAHASGTEPPLRFLGAPRTAHPWAAARPRGPPVPA